MSLDAYINQYIYDRMAAQASGKSAEELRIEKMIRIGQMNQALIDEKNEKIKVLADKYFGPIARMDLNLGLDSIGAGAAASVGDDSSSKSNPYGSVAENMLSKKTEEKGKKSSDEKSSEDEAPADPMAAMVKQLAPILSMFGLGKKEDAEDTDADTDTDAADDKADKSTETDTETKTDEADKPKKTEDVDDKDKLEEETPPANNPGDEPGTEETETGKGPAV